ncbi:MAG: hypothetical protein COX40_07195 [Candidatus Omnitrophica bacterium CG23_combo_of_CG06-09_8_20_14_all_40_11]|nr:MAG: hypothetical protein COX40_07195 [Candidatus Omnitrophica bacterium CG23_combo_of_CG06-09_8_20_14_all_40_11]
MVKSALLFFSLFLYVNLSGCQDSLEPSFKEKDIPYHVKQICKDEYKLDVITQRSETTLWIYLPLAKILDKDYGVKEGKIFDEEMTDKLRNILNTVGRVFVSSDKAPEFFALWASDINIGLDYIIIGNVLDIKKAYAESIPWTEINKRYVIKLSVNPEAIQDTIGRHLKLYNIRLPDFLAQQMVQRISVEFQGEGLKKYFKVEKIDGIFNNDAFILEYSIKPLVKPDKPIDVMKEVLNTVTYCLKIYDFQDFSRVEITDLVTQDKIVLNKAAIWENPTEKKF